MLLGQQLATSQKMLDMQMAIKINDALWSDIERKEVINRALEIFFEKRCAKEIQTIWTYNKPLPKKTRVPEGNSSDEAGDENEDENNDDEDSANVDSDIALNCDM